MVDPLWRCLRGAIPISLVLPTAPYRTEQAPYNITYNAGRNNMATKSPTCLSTLGGSPRMYIKFAKWPKSRTTALLLIHNHFLSKGQPHTTRSVDITIITPKPTHLPFSTYTQTPWQREPKSHSNLCLSLTNHIFQRNKSW